MSRLNAREAEKVLQMSLLRVTEEEVASAVDSDSGADIVPLTCEVGQISLGGPLPAPIEMDGYFSAALTGLTKDERERVDCIGRECQAVCSAMGIYLYLPGDHSDPISHAHLAKEDVHWMDRKMVAADAADIFVMLCDKPSFGAGQELEIATNAMVPIILIYQDGTKVSRMVTGTPALKTELPFSDLGDLRSKLFTQLTTLKPALVSRKLAIKENFDLNIVGTRVRTRREELALTRQEVASATKTGMTAEFLARLEDSPDRVSNPSLLQLRALAHILKMSVTELVEPDFKDVIMAALQDLAVDRAAARFGGFSDRDRREMAKQLLIKMIDGIGSK